MKEEDGSSATRMQFELKYCERCGGLWLRQVGTGQVYCAACESAIAQLPAVSHEPDEEQLFPELGCGSDSDWYEDYESHDDLDVDETGGEE